MDFKRQEGRRVRERERERTSVRCFTYLCIHWLILACTLTGDQTHYLGVSRQWSNQLSYPARARLASDEPFFITQWIVEPPYDPGIMTMPSPQWAAPSSLPLGILRSGAHVYNGTAAVTELLFLWWVVFYYRRHGNVQSPMSLDCDFPVGVIKDQTATFPPWIPPASLGLLSHLAQMSGQIAMRPKLAVESPLWFPLPALVSTQNWLCP